METLLTALRDFARFAFFQPLKGDVAKHWRTYLAIGAGLTWIVGLGRYWDNESAPLLLRSGITSLLYAVVLSGFIWLLVLGLKPERWSYRNVLLMVTMTALPGLIYAIPVEMFMDAQSASATNMIFLAIVAVWRMALYYTFLKRVSKLPAYPLLVAWLLPPAIIVAALGVYGALYAIAAGMGGVRDEADPNLASMEAIALVGLASWICLPILIPAYAFFALTRNRRSKV
jgi:hypothetical protein